MKTKNMAKVIACFAVLFCLLAVTSFAAEVRPGLNIFTGTTAAYTFDGDEADISGFKTSGVEVVTYPNDTTGNKALAYNALHNYIAVKDFPVTEADRPFDVKIDVDYSGQVRFMANASYDSGLLNQADAIVIYGKTKGEWNKLSYTIKGTQTKSAGTGDYFTDDYTGKPFPNLFVYMFSNIKEPTYVDNLSIIPYYAVKFDLCGGVGTADNEYYLQNAGTTYTILNNGSSFMKPGYTFAGWSKTQNGTADDIITSFTVEAGKDIQLYAVWEENPDDTKKSIELFDGETLRTFYAVEAGTNRVLPEFEIKDNTIMEGWQTADGNTIYGYNIPVVRDHLKLYSVWEEMETKPGINIFENGDFEKDGLVDVRPSNGRISIVTDKDGNRMAEYERGSGYASIQHYVKWEHGRKYKISYRFKADYAAGTQVNLRFDQGANHLIGQQSATANEWYSYETDYTYNNEDHTPHVYDAVNIYYNPNSENKGGTVYYDDLVFIPYYKVTYNAGGGTGAPADEYFLADKYTVSSAVPVRPGFRFKGWSLKNGSVNAVSEVTAVPGEDITLYAIWENIATDEAIVYDMTSDVPGVANGSISVICPDEVASYTNIEVYLADNDGIMDGFTPFATMKITDGMAAYAVTGNRAFAEGATRLAFVFKADGLDDITYWITIPEEHRFNPADHELKYSFWATSDSHLGGYNADKDAFTDYWPEMSRNRENALKDIFASDADFLFINGDVINYGPQGYVDTLRSFIDKRLTDPKHNPRMIPTFLVNGNHEYMNSNNANGGFDFDPVNGILIDHINYIKENYPDIKITHDGEKLWFAADIKGAKFIFLSSPEETVGGNTHTYTMSDEQLHFLEEQLYEGEVSNKTNFIVTHVPLEETYKQNGVWEDGITNSEAIREIFERHPNTVFCSGHTHSELGCETEHFVGVGDMTTTFSHLNDGGMVWISADDKVGEDNGGHIKSYSTGMYIEVYNDMVIVKSRKFLENSVYFGHATYMIPTQDSNVEVAKAEITGGNPADGVTLSADIESPENYTYKWIVAGEVVSEENTWTIDAKTDFAGEYVYLRAIDKNGYYATAKSAQPFSAATVTYDANGGSGVPASEKVFAGEYAVNNTVFPKKDGMFFIGWAESANAVKPVATVNITGDTTLYAVYTNKPKFYFDANNSGFVPNGVASTATVIDGKLVTDVITAGDQYYTWSNGSFAAADYPYMRIKVKTDGTMDGMFFKSDAGGFAESRHIMFDMVENPVVLPDGYSVYEFDILNIPQEGESWYGTISALRYDAMWSAGTTYTDYIVFTDKKGIYKAELTDYDSHNFKMTNVVKDGNSVTITLTPNEGYEFTTAEDVLSLVTVNGEKLISACVDEAGVATVTYAEPQTVYIGNVDENAVVNTVTFENPLSDATVVVAVYDENDRFIAAYVDDVNVVSSIDVYVETSLGAKYLKAFAFGDRTGINPLTEMVCKEIEYPKPKNERIVKFMEVKKNADEEYYTVYDLFDPYTGATIENIPGTHKADNIDGVSEKWTYGDIVTVENGMVADEANDEKLGTIIGGNDDLWWVLDCNTEENYIEVIKVPSVSSNDELASAVENSTVYKIDVSDAGATIIGHQNVSLGMDMVRWGSLKAADIAKLDGSDKSYLAANKTWTNPETGNLKTVYSSYVKIYLDADWVSTSDLTAVNSDGFNAEANFIIVVANTGEDTNLCVLK